MRALIIIFAILVAGCSTPYQSSGIFGGYSDVPLSADTYRIVFEGNQYTRASKAREMSLVRAAELTLDKGYERFVILDQSDWEKTTFISDDTTTTTTDATITNYGNVSQGTATSSTSGGGVSMITKPRSGLVIRFVDDSSSQYHRALIARDVLAEVGPRVGYNPLEE